MADFWVTQQKHWCKYCKKYLYNNKATIQKHENGAAHKLEVEKFLSNVYKKGKEEKKAQENLRRELERIEKAAHKSMGISTESTTETETVSSSSSKITTTTKPTTIKPPVSSKSITANLPPPPSLASLQASSSSNTTTKALKGKEEWSVKKEVAMVGQWETVTTNETKIPSSSIKKTNDNNESTNDHHQVEGGDDEEDAQEDLSQFKIKEKEYPIDGFFDDNNNDDHKEEGNNGSLFKKRKLGQKGNLKKKLLRKK
ncbi:unnamed protein product [Cunninghamella blakesleeana]